MCVCGTHWDPDPSHSAGRHNRVVLLLLLAVRLSTHTRTLGWGGLQGDSLSYDLKFTRKSWLQSYQQGDLHLPVSELCCLSLPQPRLLQVTDSCPSPVWPLSGARVTSQDVGMTTPCFLFLLMSCSDPVCASMRVLPTTTSLCVLLFQKNILALFILKAIVYLLWNINIYRYTIK